MATPKKKVVVEKIAKKWLSTDEAASYIGMGKSFIVELRKSGKLPHCMIGQIDDATQLRIEKARLEERVQCLENEKAFLQRMLEK